MNDKQNDSDMTVNERLYGADLLDAFYKAANKRDRNEMISILMAVDFERPQAEEIADGIINHPVFVDS